ncbi:MAG: carboxypeptidase M32 [Asgard group archaeon]|nr:carboxypeptidase M32 [Asgard group archaeon]
MDESVEELTPYQDLLSKYKEYVILNNVIMTLYWDMDTYMPKKGLTQRSEELAKISGLIHDRITDPKIGELLKTIKEQDDYEKFSPVEKRNIFLIQREYDRNTKIPKELVEAISKQSAIGNAVWKKAKADSNYELFKPELIKIFKLIKKAASFMDPTKDPYDVLLDLNEPGYNSEIIDNLFKELRDGLKPLIKAIVNSPNQPDYSLIRRNCPLDVQEKLSQELAKIAKYDLDAGRIDETIHPFTIGYYDDVRITTNYQLDDFTGSLFSVLHEAGHGIYEQNMPKEFKYQPIGSYCSDGFHESQSRFIENLIGRSREFWEYFLPKLKEITGDIFADVDLDAFVHAINRVIPSKIRVEADPVTYSMHVIIRHEIEKGLFAGKISFDDLPQIWNNKMKEYLDVTIENDAEGVLQDVHWSNGQFGSFPAYSFGNIIDGQLLWKLEQVIPDWKAQVKKGDLTEIINWLKVNVHQKGNILDPLDLIKEITGEELSTKYYLVYLRKEFSKIYDLKDF